MLSVFLFIILILQVFYGMQPEKSLNEKLPTTPQHTNRTFLELMVTISCSVQLFPWLRGKKSFAYFSNFFFYKNVPLMFGKKINEKVKNSPGEYEIGVVM